MKRLAAALLLLACGRPEAEMPRDQTVTTTAPDPAPLSELNVRLESPGEGDVIRDNPVQIRGQARTFENNVVIRLLDAEGELMVETFTTATGEMGIFSPFSREVFLTRMPGPQLTVQAFEYSAKDGSIQHLNSVTAPTELQARQTTLYFPSAKRSPTDCSKVFPIKRNMPASISVARLIVEALVAGPTDEERADGFDVPFPSGVQLRAVNLRDGVLTVDFNERLGNVGGSCRALAIRASLEQTLGQLPNVTKVRITAMGDEKIALQP